MSEQTAEFIYPVSPEACELPPNTVVTATKGNGDIAYSTKSLRIYYREAVNAWSFQGDDWQ